MPPSLSLQKGYEHAYRCSYVDEEGEELFLPDCLCFLYEAGSMVVP